MKLIEKERRRNKSNEINLQKNDLECQVVKTVAIESGSEIRSKAMNQIECSRKSNENRQ